MEMYLDTREGAVGHLGEVGGVVNLDLLDFLRQIESRRAHQLQTPTRHLHQPVRQEPAQAHRSTPALHTSTHIELKLRAHHHLLHTHFHIVIHTFW